MKMEANQWTTKSRKNVKNLAVWTFAWLVTLALVSFGAKFLWNFNTGISILFIVLNTAIGVGMIISNIRYIQGLDEMQRKLNLEAMSIALGVGVVGGISFSMLDITNVIPFDAEISILVMLIGLTYLAGIVIGNLRYK